MVESWLVHPHLTSVLHELVRVVEPAVWSQRNIALYTEQYLDFHAPLHSILESPYELVRQCEVWVYELYAVFGVVDGVKVKVPDYLVPVMWLAVYDANHLAAGTMTGVRLQSFEVAGVLAPMVEPCVVERLACYLFPHLDEYSLQRVHLLTADAAVHIVPRAHLLRTFYIIVGDVHASGICNSAVDDYYFPVVAVEHVVEEREPYRVELIDLYALGADVLDVALAHRTVVAGIAEAVEDKPYLHPLSSFGGKMLDELAVYGVVTEVEILHVDGASCLVDGHEEVIELLLSVGKKRDGIVMGETYSLPAHLVGKNAVGSLRYYCHTDCQQKDS